MCGVRQGCNVENELGEWRGSAVVFEQLLVCCSGQSVVFEQVG